MTCSEVEDAKKKEPKKKPAAKKKKENKNPNQSEGDDDIKATHADVTNMGDLSTTVSGSRPLLESTTNDLTLNVTKKKTASKAAAKKANVAKFNYTHRISVKILFNFYLKFFFLYGYNIIKAEISFNRFWKTNMDH